jgi:hypothetical protein
VKTRRQDGRWHKDHDRCLRCKTDERFHQGFGLCTKCYIRQRSVLKADYLYEQRKRSREMYREKIKAGQQRAVAKNPEHYRRKGIEWARDNKSKWVPGRVVEFVIAGYKVRAVILRYHRGKPWRVDVRTENGTLLEMQDTRTLTPRMDLPRVEAR